MKGGLAIALLKKRDTEGEDKADGDSEDEAKMPPMEDIAGDLIDAVKAGDRAGVAKALRASYAACGDSEDTEEQDDNAE